VSSRLPGAAELLALHAEWEVSHCSALIEAGDEVFNSYGSLSSAHLACEYGFIPEEAGALPEDRVHFDLALPAASSAIRSIGDSLFATRPHALVEPSILGAHLSREDRVFVSADGQLSEPLFLALAERAKLADAKAAVEILFDAGEFLVEEWKRLQGAVVSALDAKLAAYEDQETLFDLLEVRLTLDRACQSTRADILASVRTRRTGP
jgi:hypothetical protein